MCLILIWPLPPITILFVEFVSCFDVSCWSDSCFSLHCRQMLPKFEIGTLVSREFVPYKADESGFYREMCKRVGQASLE